MAKKIIMSWSKCKIEVGKTGDDEAMAATLTDVGTINDKSTTLATEDGETLTATATGGIVVAEEEGEPVVTLTTRVKEMDFDKEKMFNGAEVSEDGDELTVKTNVVSDDFSVKLTPKNIGAIDIWSVGCVCLEILTGKPPYYNLTPDRAAPRRKDRMSISRSRCSPAPTGSFTRSSASRPQTGPRKQGHNIARC